MEPATVSLRATQDVGETTRAEPVAGEADAAAKQPIDAHVSQPSNARTGSTTVTSPTEALRLEEMERSRVFFRVALGLTLGGIVIALTSHGDPIAKTVLIVGSTASALGALYILTIVLRPDRYDQRLILLPGLPVLFGAMSGVYYWGTISPVSGMLVFGIYFFSLGPDPRLTVAHYVVISVSHGLLGVGMITGLIVDRGLIRMSALRRIDQVAVILIVEFLYLVAFITARLSQRTTLRAVSSLEKAVRDVAQREALLAEARAELDRVREVGGPGKFTEQLMGSYRLGPLIGRGGMGEVYEAQHTSIRRDAAVKLLRPGADHDAMYLQRFLREGEAMARIDSPNVVRVYDVGATTGAIPFIVMERLRGHDLAEELRTRRQLGLGETRAIVEQIAHGLEAARRHGIVHRDLKPNNVFIAEVDDGRVCKLLDFGVSKLGDSGTLTGAHILGTPGYMAPEQARADDVDHRADVYSLAAIAYRAVTGYPAFAGKDLAATLLQVLHRVPARPSKLALVSPDVDRVLALGLAKDPAHRFQTATEFAAWFAAAIDGNLDAAQRRRGDEQIARAPWGADVSAPTETG